VGGGENLDFPPQCFFRLCPKCDVRYIRPPYRMVVWFIFLGIVGEWGMGKHNRRKSSDSGKVFQASLNVAWLAWQDLNAKLVDLNQGQFVDTTDIIKKFQECAEAATEVCSAIQPKEINLAKEINLEDREKIGAIIDGDEEGKYGLTVLFEEFEEFQNQLTLDSEQERGWAILRRQVSDACRGLDRV
jgi:hypothetical protein